MQCHGKGDMTTWKQNNGGNTTSHGPWLDEWSLQFHHWEDSGIRTRSPHSSSSSFEHCIAYFSPCWDEIPHNNNQIKSLYVRINHHIGKQVHEDVSHTSCTVRKQRQTDGCSSSAWFSLFGPEPSLCNGMLLTGNLGLLIISVDVV